MSVVSCGGPKCADTLFRKTSSLSRSPPHIKRGHIQNLPFLNVANIELPPASERI